MLNNINWFGKKTVLVLKKLLCQVFEILNEQYDKKLIVIFSLMRRYKRI